jgi:hypothetical protein
MSKASRFSDILSAISQAKHAIETLKQYTTLKENSSGLSHANTALKLLETVLANEDIKYPRKIRPIDLTGTTIESEVLLKVRELAEWGRSGRHQFQFNSHPWELSGELLNLINDLTPTEQTKSTSEFVYNENSNYKGD